MINRLQNRQIISGYIFAICATIIWSGNFIIARGLSESIPPISLAFWRWVVAVIVFLPFALKALIADWDILKKNIPYLAITSLLGITIFNTLIYLAGHTTTAINLSLTVPPVEYDAKTVLSILYVGVFASLSAFVLWNKAIVAVGPSKAGMIYYTLPIFTGFWAYLFLKEDISIIHFYSVLLIISGILTANYKSKKVLEK